MNDNLKWYNQSGADGDVIISTRIRFARNLTDFPFPDSLDETTNALLNKTVKKAFENIQFSPKLNWLDMDGMTNWQVMSLVERHLISPTFASKKLKRYLLLSENENISIMINEEDHIRLQVMEPGLNLEKAYELANAIDDKLDSELAFAFDDKLGYLTQCPTNLGTGMRASLMLHLPALHNINIINTLASTVSKLGLTIRGMYGEGSKSHGAIFQLSNQVTLGISELAAIENLQNIAKQIIHEEREARHKLQNSPVFEDSVWRSLGILRNARIMPHSEFMSLISNVRVGVSLNLISDINLDKTNSLLSSLGPATIMAAEQRDLSNNERDILRASSLRNNI